MAEIKSLKPSELEALLVEHQEGDIDRLLREALEGRIAIERASGRVLPRPGLFKLSQSQRILVLLLARHAASKLGVSGSSLEASAEDLASGTQVPVKSCREQLSRLKAGGMITKGARGYQLPSWNLLLAIENIGPANSAVAR